MTACALKDCGTLLSAYNPGALCHTHAAERLTPLLHWLSPQPWHEQARCRRFGWGTNRFFTEPYSRNRDDPMSSHAVRAAKAMCATCPVRRQCLADCMHHESADKETSCPGIWGGTLEQERRRARRQRRGLSAQVQLDMLLEDMSIQARSRGLIGKEAAA